MSRRLGFSSSVLWAFDPTFVPFIDLFDRRILVYHVTDNYIEFLSRSATQQRALIARYHQLLLRRADVVFAVSPQLHEQCRQVNESTYLIPNGVDFARFQRSMADAHVPEDIRGIPRPIIGYVGHIESNLDVEMVRWVAGARPDWSLVFIGPADATAREELIALARRHLNVYYLGAKRPEEVPYYIKCLDAAMMIDRERTDGDSIKLYEYLACGKPVVSIDADSVQRAKHLVWLAKDGPEFVRCLEQALHEHPSLAEARIAFARGETWQSRLETVTAAIERHLSQAMSFQALQATRES
jgi:glycosyltransferase involved in cell wall biosynthesis